MSKGGDKGGLPALQRLADAGNAGAQSILSRQPELYSWLEPIVVAFWRLSRSGTMSGYIPMSEIIAYHTAFDREYEYELGDFVRLIYAANDASLAASKQ